MEFSNIPNNIPENQLESKVIQIFRESNVEVDHNDIEGCHRLPVSKYSQGDKSHEVVLIKMATKLDKFCVMAFVRSSLTLPTGQMYVRKIFVEHSHEIFPEYSEKVTNENPGNIPK